MAYRYESYLLNLPVMFTYESKNRTYKTPWFPAFPTSDGDRIDVSPKGCELIR